MDFAGNTEKRSEISRKLKGLPKICVLPAKRNFGPLNLGVVKHDANYVSDEIRAQKLQLRAKKRLQTLNKLFYCFTVKSLMNSDLRIIIL